ncbi:MAG: CDF family Co(II)/Ni(II) efflux transporter DmeF [Rhodobacterales bacterium]|nr:CDF family Co(II)/Ni(II) efflux transporter DmeF [Rhodobacterales bacterium]
MHIHSLDDWRHDHLFAGADEARNEKRTFWVVVLTAATMGVEIGAGMLFNSMALLADGWHMASHAAALGITLFTYWYARRHARDARYTFGTGKVGVLGGYTSGLVLAMVALLMVWESVHRFLEPVAIRFPEAISVAVLGLVVNLLSAWLLHAGGHDHHHDHHHHDHDHDHDHDHGHSHAKDLNLNAAFLHVVADAMTSVLAIAALIAGWVWGWVWMDPLMGIVGALVIARWTHGLLRDTGRVLLDGAVDRDTREHIRGLIEADADNRVVDLHVWRVGTGHLSAIVTLVTHYPRPPDAYKALLAGVPGLTHVTVEVQSCGSEPCLPVDGAKDVGAVG